MERKRASMGLGVGGVGLLTTIIAAPVVLGLEIGALGCGLLGMAGKFISRRLAVKAKKHDEIKVLAESKLNTITSHISTALIDGKISDEEFKLFLDEVQKNNQMKSQIRVRARQNHAAITPPVLDEETEKKTHTEGQRRSSDTMEPFEQSDGTARTSDPLAEIYFLGFFIMLMIFLLTFCVAIRRFCLPNEVTRRYGLRTNCSSHFFDATQSDFSVETGRCSTEIVRHSSSQRERYEETTSIQTEQSGQLYKETQNHAFSDFPAETNHSCIESVWHPPSQGERFGETTSLQVEQSGQFCEDTPNHVFNDLPEETNGSGIENVWNLPNQREEYEEATSLRVPSQWCRYELQREHSDHFNEETQDHVLNDLSAATDCSGIDLVWNPPNQTERYEETSLQTEQSGHFYKKTSDYILNGSSAETDRYGINIVWNSRKQKERCEEKTVPLSPCLTQLSRTVAVPMEYKVISIEVGVQTEKTESHSRKLQYDGKNGVSEKSTMRVAPMVIGKTRAKSDCDDAGSQTIGDNIVAIEVDTGPTEVQTEEVILVQGRTSRSQQRTVQSSSFSPVQAPILYPEYSDLYGYTTNACRDFKVGKVFKYLRSELPGLDWKMFFRELYDKSKFSRNPDSLMKEMQQQNIGDIKEQVYYMLTEWWQKCRVSSEDKKQFLMSILKQEDYHVLYERANDLLSKVGNDSCPYPQSFHLQHPIHVAGNTLQIFPVAHGTGNTSTENTGSITSGSVVPTVEFPEESHVETEIPEPTSSNPNLRCIYNQLSKGTFISDDFQRQVLCLLSSDLGLPECELCQLRICDVAFANSVDVRGTECYAITIPNTLQNNCSFRLIQKETWEGIFPLVELRRRTCTDDNMKLFNIDISTESNRQHGEEITERNNSDSETTYPRCQRSTTGSESEQSVTFDPVSTVSPRYHGRRYFTEQQAKEIKEAFIAYIQFGHVTTADVRRELQHRPKLSKSLCITFPYDRDTDTKCKLKKVVDRIWTFIKEKRRNKTPKVN